jgi:hypothetical protein
MMPLAFVAIAICPCECPVAFTFLAIDVAIVSVTFGIDRGRTANQALVIPDSLNAISVWKSHDSMTCSASIDK